MQRYLLKRVLLFVPTALLAAFIIFLIMKAAPGDVVTVIVYGDEGYSGSRAEGLAAEEKLREELGLNRHVVVQFFDWLKMVARGDLGDTYLQTGRSTVEVIGERFPRTLELALAAILLTFLWAVPLGVLSAVKADTSVDRIIQVFSVSGLSIPNFWLATLALIFLSRYLGWTPPIGWVSLFDDPMGNFQKMYVPVLILSYGVGAPILRMTRGQMLEVLREDYIRTARAKGLPGMTVIRRHALRNSLIPIITLIGWDLGRLINGAVIIEFIFTIPGLGSLFVQAITARDFAIIQGLVLINVTIMLSINLIIDMLYGWMDPRIRYS